MNLGIKLNTSTNQKFFGCKKHFNSYFVQHYIIKHQGIDPKELETPRLPALAAIEGSLRARQRTAALGALFAVVGLQSMVGLMVAKVCGGEVV